MSFANAWGSSFGSSSTAIIKNVFVDYGSVELSNDSEIIAINSDDEIQCIFDTDVFLVELKSDFNPVYVDNNQEAVIEIDDVDFE